MKPICIAIALLMGCFFFSCKKDTDHGSVLITVKYNGQVISEPMIYMKAGTLTNPNIPLSKFDKSMSGDASGQATFEDLAPGNYYFYGKGYSSSKATYVTGEVGVTIRSRWRQNWYEVAINTH